MYLIVYTQKKCTSSLCQMLRFVIHICDIRFLILFLSYTLTSPSLSLFIHSSNLLLPVHTPFSSLPPSPSPSSKPILILTIFHKLLVQRLHTLDVDRQHLVLRYRWRRYPPHTQEIGVTESAENIERIWLAVIEEENVGYWLVGREGGGKEKENERSKQEGYYKFK